MEDSNPLNEPLSQQLSSHQKQETGICNESVDRAITLIPATCPHPFVKLAYALAATTLAAKIGLRISEVQSLILAADSQSHRDKTL
jgi:hypothetical protein